MNKDKILEISRKENKDMDLVEKEIMQKAGNTGAMAATILATIFVVIQIIVGDGMNWGLYAIVFCFPATGYIVKSIRMKRNNDIILAVIETIVVLLLSFAHIFNLLQSSSIL